MASGPIIVLFRRDLRLGDNPALGAAARAGEIVPVFVLDDKAGRPLGRAARWWLERSLDALGKELASRGQKLILRQGATLEVVSELSSATGAAAVYWNRRYSKVETDSDAALKAALVHRGLEAKSFNAALIREPWEMRTQAGGPFRVFTPFFRALRDAGPESAGATAPKSLKQPATPQRSDSLKSLGLYPAKPDWAREFSIRWTPGEAGAWASVQRFFDGPAKGYASGRDRPDQQAVSRLSPHLAFGEISPAALWRTAHARMEAGGLARRDGEKFLSELAWREFNYHLLHRFPQMTEAPLRKEFDQFPWTDNRALFSVWAEGRTGYPIVDAGMRELWRTGWMHNRVRMIAASFLVKDLMIPWRSGEGWFWDALVDADVANNAGNWQWVAGCGADSSPFFRIFNPVTQGERFDPEGDYVRTYVPELARLPAVFIHKPWAAPKAVLREAGVEIGRTYPEPVVDHAAARKRALDAFERMRTGLADASAAS
jgi:deoxyribodipyrimidine photo-lyase